MHHLTQQNQQSAALNNLLNADSNGMCHMVIFQIMRHIIHYEKHQLNSTAKHDLPFLTWPENIIDYLNAI